jgi:hypothetical protein
MDLPQYIDPNVRHFGEERASIERVIELPESDGEAHEQRLDAADMFSLGFNRIDQFLVGLW